LDEKQITPVLDPKKLLKRKGYLRQTSATASKVHQTIIMQFNDTILAEEINLNFFFKQVCSAQASTSKLEFKLETPEVIVHEVKFEIDQTIPVS
jgi:hypothetical protein